MPRFSCPYCHNSLTASEEQRGSILSCTHCDKRIRVPAGKPAVKPAAMPPAFQDNLDEENSSEAPAKVAPSHSKTKKAAVQPRHGDDDPEPEGDDQDQGTKRRKTTSLIGNICGSIGALVLVAVIILVVSGKWKTVLLEPLEEFFKNQGIPPAAAAAAAAGAAAVIVLVPIGIWWGTSTKATVVSNIPEKLKFRPVNLEEFPNLETEDLERWTGITEALGFRRLMDYQVKTDLNNHMKGFARLFVHPREHCFVEINQAFPQYGDPSAIGCSFISYLEDDWTLSHGNRKPSTALYLIRRPKAMWVCMPDEPVEKIWAAHLKRRKTIAKDLGVEVLTDNTAEGHFEKEKQATLDRKKAVEGRSFIRILLDQWLFDKNPKYEWVGDYPRAAKKRN